MAAHSKDVHARSLSPWGKALAGAMAACLANTLVYPLDLAKTRLQVQDEGNAGKDEQKQLNEMEKAVESTPYYTGVLDVIQKVYARGGLKALYSGLFGNLAGTVSTTFAYFYWYSLLRALYVEKYSHTQSLTTATELFLGALAGAIAQLFTIPVSVVTTRQQTDDVPFYEALQDVLKHDGVRGLWRGLKASLILVVNPSITYGSSSRLRSLLFEGKQYLSVPENFVLGAISKSLATIATQPLIVAKVVQQSSSKFHSFIDVLVHLIKSGGIKALFRGIGPQISKGILVQGLLLAFKDKVESYILKLLLATYKPTTPVAKLV